MKNKFLKCLTTISLLLIAVNASAKDYYKCTKLNEEARIKDAWGNPIPKFSFESCLSVERILDENNVERVKFNYGVDFGAVRANCISNGKYYLRTITTSGLTTESDQDYISDYGDINWKNLISNSNIENLNEVVVNNPNSQIFVTRIGTKTVASIDNVQPFDLNGFKEDFSLIFNFNKFRKTTDGLNRDIACVKLN